MKKEIFILLVVVLLISGCSGIPTGKGVAEVDPEVNEKIQECINLCGDEGSEDEFYRSCSQIYEYGGEELFNDYVNQCR